MKSRFVQPAELEVAEALEHYQQITTGLGERFLGEVRRAVSMVEQFPHNSPVTASDVRKKVLLEFPYTLFYRVTSDEVIISLSHIRGSDHFTGDGDLPTPTPANWRLQPTQPASMFFRVRYHSACGLRG